MAKEQGTRTQEQLKGADLAVIVPGIGVWVRDTCPTLLSTG